MFKKLFLKLTFSFKFFHSPLGKTLASFLTASNIRIPGQGAQLSQAPQAQRREGMAEGNAAASTDNADEEIYTPSPSKRKVYKYADTPITYKDVDVSKLINSNLNQKFNKLID